MRNEVATFLTWKIRCAGVPISFACKTQSQSRSASVVGGPCGDEYSRVQLFTYTLVFGIGVLVVCGAGHPTVDGECSRKMTWAAFAAASAQVWV